MNSSEAPTEEAISSLRMRRLVPQSSRRIVRGTPTSGCCSPACSSSSSSLAFASCSPSRALPASSSAMRAASRACSERSAMRAVTSVERV